MKLNFLLLSTVFSFTTALWYFASNHWYEPTTIRCPTPVYTVQPEVITEAQHPTESTYPKQEAVLNESKKCKPFEFGHESRGFFIQGNAFTHVRIKGLSQSGTTWFTSIIRSGFKDKCEDASKHQFELFESYELILVIWRIPLDRVFSGYTAQLPASSEKTVFQYLEKNLPPAIDAVNEAWESVQKYPNSQIHVFYEDLITNPESVYKLIQEVFCKQDAQYCSVYDTLIETHRAKTIAQSKDLVPSSGVKMNRAVRGVIGWPILELKGQDRTKILDINKGLVSELYSAWNFYWDILMAPCITINLD